MTELLSRPPRARARRPRPTPPAPAARLLPAAGVGAALRAAGLGALAVMVLVLVGWAAATDSGAGAGEAVATALQAWLLGHHARLTVPGGLFGLTPLGLTVLPLVLVHLATLRAGRLAGVRGRGAVVTLAASVTATYAVVASLVALLARTDAVRVLPVSAFVGAALVAGVGATTGALRAGAGWAGVSRRLPEPVRAALPASGMAVAVLLGGGALLAGSALAGQRGRAAALFDGLDAGPGGGLLLAVLCLVYVPTAAVWGLSYVVGPGVAVGTGTTVGVAGTDLGAVPAFPLLAALPQEPGPPWAPLVLVVPLAAGVLAGLLAGRAAVAAGWRGVVVPAGTIGAQVAVAVAVLAWLASGPAGPGRMADTGPDWWAAAPAAGLEVAVVVAATLLVVRRRRGRR